MITEARDSLFWRSVTYGFCAFFATFPFINFSGFLYFGTATRAVTLTGFALVLGSALAVWSVAQEKSRVALPRSPILGAVLVYGLALIVSAMQGVNFSTSFWSLSTRMTGLWYFSMLLIFMLGLWNVLQDRARHHVLVLYITIPAALYSVGYLLGTLHLFGLPSNDGFTFANSSFGGMYLFASFMLALYYVLQAEQKKWWMYALPVLLAISPATLHAGVWSFDFSKGIVGVAEASTAVFWLSVPLLGVFLLIARVKNAQLRKRIDYSLFLFTVIAAGIASYSLFSPTGYLRALYLKNSSAARPVVWQMSEKAIGERPLLGWGTDTFERVFEQHYDNRLLEEAYGHEAWFDRAHNLFVDQTVDNGFVGLAAYVAIYLVTILCLMYVARVAKNNGDRLFAEALIVYFVLHLAEGQTAFDTSISYPLLAFMIVSAGVLYERVRREAGRRTELSLHPAARYTGAFVLLLYCGWSLFYGFIPIVRAEMANGDVRSGGSAAERLPMYSVLLGSPMDEQGFLWRIMTDFERGIQENPKSVENPANVANFEKEMVIYENGFKDILKRDPTNIRAHLSLANVLIYQNLFRVNKLQEAQDVLDQTIALAPQMPQPYWMKAVAYIYMAKFQEARAYAQKGLALNPNIKQSQTIVQYVDQSIRTFPNIILYFFSYI